MDEIRVILTLLYILISLGFIWILFTWVGDIAERRGQDRLLWQISALFINPFLAALLLWFFCERVEEEAE
ncbi:MAG: hypothetical protein CSA70_07160 [Rhodobacterales bacterium]|nr:MAG: hypothetical protein CSA70_07160 [Rhodobacterales bacterium]